MLTRYYAITLYTALSCGTNITRLTYIIAADYEGDLTLFDAVTGQSIRMFKVCRHCVYGVLYMVGTVCMVYCTW